MNKMILAMVVAISLSACTELGGNAQAALMAEKRVASDLKDPDSATFTGLYTVRATTPDETGGLALHTCGYVNSRNGFGGYAGNSRFVVEQRVNAKLGTFDNVYAWYEEPKYRGLHYGATPEKPASSFEFLYWNEKCVDSTHPASFTAPLE